MGKPDFGVILSSLRSELYNEFDSKLTQVDLANLINAPLITIQTIEQGRKTSIKSQMVRDLANALKVPSYARTNFYLSALGLDQQDLVREKLDIDEILLLVQESLVTFQSPSVLANAFGDIIAGNPLFFKLLNLDPDELKAGPYIKRNLNYIFFSPESESLQKIMGDSFITFAQRRIMLLKSETLLYRNHWYYRKLIPHLNRFPLFKKFWQTSIFHDEDSYFLTNPITLRGPGLGKLAFLSIPFPFHTPDIMLRGFVYQPQDKFTAITCANLSEELGTQMARVSDVLVPPPSLDITK